MKKIEIKLDRKTIEEEFLGTYDFKKGIVKSTCDLKLAQSNVQSIFAGNAAFNGTLKVVMGLRELYTAILGDFSKNVLVNGKTKNVDLIFNKDDIIVLVTLDDERAITQQSSNVPNVQALVDMLTQR